jgi:hypothetical protein
MGAESTYRRVLLKLQDRHFCLEKLCGKFLDVLTLVGQTNDVIAMDWRHFLGLADDNI